MSFHDKQFILILTLLAAALSGGCGSQPSSPVEELRNTELLIAGALNTSFPDAITLAKVQSRNTDQYFILSISGNKTVEDKNEQISLIFSLPVDFEDDLPVEGDYLFADEGSGQERLFQGECQYRLDLGRELQATYLFRGERMQLRVERAGRDRVRGRFSLSGKQLEGIRIEHGQRFDHVDLGNDGEITISGKFEIEI